MDSIFHNTLPFTSTYFFGFIGISVLLALFAKFVLKQKVNFKWVILIINLLYLAFLFPKPIQLLGLVIYLYLVIIALRKWYKHNNLLLPFLLLSIPIFWMKLTNIMDEKNVASLLTMQLIIQIAGLSYMVFKAIGLYVDERNTTLKIDFISFFNFCTFVPALFIGPIDRYKPFNTNVANGYKNINLKEFGVGYNYLIIGLLYKFILAEAIHRLCISHLQNDHSIWFHVNYMYSYLFYLFFDFAGYSLLAMSFAKFIGIEIPINFNKPFAAANPKEFWKRWHKSLGDWLNDYFFKPIFKFFTTKQYFKPITRQNLALFLTFLLMGFWNGFEIHYVVSGTIFGLISVVHNYYIYLCKKNQRDVVFGKLNPKMVNFISILLMFNLVAFAIYIFSGIPI